MALDPVLELFLAVALGGSETPAPAPLSAPRVPVPDSALIARAAAAHKIMRAGAVDGPVLLSYVVWPSAELAAAA